MESIKERNCMDILRSIVIFANSKTIVNMKYTKAEVKGSVIRCDQLIEHMKKLHTANENGHWLVESGMYKVVEVLMAHHKDIEVDYTQKYNIGTDIKNEPSSSLTQIPIEETEIYKDLKEYRLLKSREEGIKAYYIFTNAQLEQIISLRPNNTDMLMNINGFAKRQCEKYGDAIIQTVKRYMPV
jgi:superfamily II DNA helicase RecQ